MSTPTRIWNDLYEVVLSPLRERVRRLRAWWDAQENVPGAMLLWLSRTTGVELEDIFAAVFFLASYLVQRAGRTIDSGERGLKFSFGRAVRTLEAGFHPLVPGLQTIRVVPSRERTLDLEAQRCVTREGLVFDVDANLAYQIVDLEKALLEISDLEQGLRDALAVSVQQVLRGSVGEDVVAGGVLDARLEETLRQRVEVWGIQVHSAGFRTVRPTAQTTRITQLRQMVLVRREALAMLESRGASRREALAIIGFRARYQSRAASRRRLLTVQERQRRLRVSLGRDLELPESVIRSWERVRSA